MHTRNCSENIAPLHTQVFQTGHDKLAGAHRSHKRPFAQAQCGSSSLCQDPRLFPEKEFVPFYPARSDTPRTGHQAPPTSVLLLAPCSPLCSYLLGEALPPACPGEAAPRFCRFKPPQGKAAMQGMSCPTGAPGNGGHVPACCAELLTCLPHSPCTAGA